MDGVVNNLINECLHYWYQIRYLFIDVGVEGKSLWACPAHLSRCLYVNLRPRALHSDNECQPRTIIPSHYKQKRGPFPLPGRLVIRRCYLWDFNWLGRTCETLHKTIRQSYDPGRYQCLKHRQRLESLILRNSQQLGGTSFTVGGACLMSDIFLL